MKEDLQLREGEEPVTAPQVEQRRRALAGLIKAFQQAAERAKAGQVPRDMEKFFLT